MKILCVFSTFIDCCCFFPPSTLTSEVDFAFLPQHRVHLQYCFSDGLLYARACSKQMHKMSFEFRAHSEKWICSYRELTVASVTYFSYLTFRLWATLIKKESFTFKTWWCYDTPSCFGVRSVSHSKHLLIGFRYKYNLSLSLTDLLQLR